MALIIGSFLLAHSFCPQSIVNVETVFDILAAGVTNHWLRSSQFSRSSAAHRS